MEPVTGRKGSRVVWVSDDAGCLFINPFDGGVGMLVPMMVPYISKKKGQA